MLFNHLNLPDGLPTIVESPRPELNLETSLQKVIDVWKSNASLNEKTIEWRNFITRFPEQELKILDAGVANFQRINGRPPYPNLTREQLEIKVFELLRRGNPGVLEGYLFDWKVSKRNPAT